MSRSNPIDSTPNPATAWLEWKGKSGQLEYWDKTKQEAVVVKLPFTFILLDRLSTVRGYNKKMGSGIYANEVRDTLTDPFVVKAFKGGIIAEGLWRDIKDRVTSRSVGAGFAINCYIGAKEGDGLEIAALQLTGCALGPWIEFEQAHSKPIAPPDDPNGKKVKEVYAKAITVKAGPKQTEGDIEFIPPVFTITPLKPETNKLAIALDRELQAYLESYFTRTHKERVMEAGSVPTHPTPEPQPEPSIPEEPMPTDEEVPF